MGVKRPSSSPDSSTSQKRRDVKLSESSRALAAAERTIEGHQAATQEMLKELERAVAEYNDITREPNVTLDILETGARIAQDQYEEAKRSLLNQEDPFGPHSYLTSMEPLGAGDRTYTTEEIIELQRRAEKADLALGAWHLHVDEVGEKVREIKKRLKTMQQDQQQARMVVEQVGAALPRELLEEPLPHLSLPTDYNDGNSAPAPSDQRWPEEIEDPAGILSTFDPEEEERSMTPKGTEDSVSDKSAPSPQDENNEWAPDRDDKKRRTPAQKTGAVKKRRSQKKTTTQRK